MLWVRATRLGLLPPAAKNVSWEEFYPMGQNANITMQELPGTQVRAAAAGRKPLVVHSRFSFYWGTAESLDMSPVGAALYCAGGRRRGPFKVTGPRRRVRRGQPRRARERAVRGALRAGGANE